MTDLDNMLLEKLKAIYDDKDFIVGIFSNADNQDDRQRIVDYIDAGEEVTVENLLLLSVFLDNKDIIQKEILLEMKNFKGNRDEKDFILSYEMVSAMQKCHEDKDFASH